MLKKFSIYFLVVFFISMLGISEASAQQEVRKKQLAIFNSYNEVAPWPRKYINQIIQEISMHPDFNAVRVTHLNNSLIYDQYDFDALQDKVFESYEEKPDYLVLIGNFAFTLRERIKEEWGDIPMLLISQNNRCAPTDFYFTEDIANDSIMPRAMTPLENFRKDYNFSLVLTPNKHKETVDMMMEMYPDMKKIVFMADGLYINRHLSHVIRDYIQLKYPNVEYEWLLAGEDGVMLPYLNNTDPNIGLLLSTWYYTAPGIGGFPVMNAADSFLINGAKRPVFGLRYAYMAYGILGGYFVSPDEIYVNVMAGLADLISNKNMRNVPFRIPSQAFPYINYSKLQTLDIPEKICPDDTVFIDKPASFWDVYRTQLIVGGSALLLVILIVVLWCLSSKKLRFRQSYDSLVNSMPIGYMRAVIDLDKEGNIKAVHYYGQNTTLRTLVDEHNLKALKSEEYANYWQDTADSIVADFGQKGSIIKAPDDDTYIEFMINPDKKSTETRLLLDVFAIDVTDKMKVEQVLRDAAQKAVEADNMKSAFLANMSHEIRTPLNAIVGFANLLCKTTDQEKKKKFVEIIETNNHLLLKLIGDILDISKADADKLVFNMHKVDVNKLLITTCSGIDMDNRPDVRLEMRPGMDECFISSDPYRITQVLNNLVTNAIKFTERGSITVGYDLTQNNMLRFYVKDTGLGISAAEMPKLFGRFTKLNSFIQGTGLGLSISKAIVEKLGGTMRAESAGRGKGSTFYFTIPYVLNEADINSSEDDTSDDQTRLEALKQKARGASAEANNALRGGSVDPSMPSYKHERKKILVVEDNESNYQLFEALLADRFDIVHAKDGEESVRLYARETPDLVLMDINLPYKNGFEATAEIRMLSKTVPIIAVTAYAQRSDKEQILSSGFSAYLSKPIEENELINEIRKFI